MGMSYLLVTFFLLCLLVQLVPLTADDDRPYFPREECISGSGNYTNNSSYLADLSILLTSSSNAQVKYGFYNSSVGEVNGIGLCRGDITQDKCHSCIRNSTQDIRQLCPNYREAILYQDVCMLRYSNRSIFGRQEYRPPYILYNTFTFPDPEASGKKRDNLLLELRDKAATGGTLRKYATGEAATSLNTIYALVQCTPDLEYQDCVACVGNLSDAAFQTSSYQKGVTAMAPSCIFRYETYAFYEPLLSAPPQSPPPPSFDGKRKSHRTRHIVIFVILAVVSVILIFCICIYICFKRRKPKTKDTEAEEELLEVESLQHTLGSIRDATDNFSDSNKLGQGGFGAVYKGKLSNGQDIAVKRLSQGSGQGELEFKNEVLLVAKLQHRNLARLLGFCLEGTERLLVYEFVANGSLDHFLFGPINCSKLFWERRYKIIIGIARGLLYLHEDSRLRIIHRDLKTSNILLDGEMNPKISDFGMAKLFPLDETQGDTKRIVGTYGYMAPEYAMFGTFSIKSDVYSFGILILEILSGQKNTSFSYGENMEGLTNFAWRCWKEGSTSNLIDPSINSGSRSEMMRCIHVGLLCVQENPADRPTMASIVLMLSSHSTTLPLPSRPGFSLHSGATHSMNCKTKLETPFLHDSHSGVTSSGDDVSTQISINEASISELYPR